MGYIRMRSKARKIKERVFLFLTFILLIFILVSTVSDIRLANKNGLSWYNFLGRNGDINKQLHEMNK